MKLKKKLLIFVIIGFSSLILEVITRRYIGLGTPILYESYDGMEYKLKPNQNIKRFGNKIKINNASMRTSHNIVRKNFSEKKRILIFGDSVLYGTSLITQEKIATSLLSNKIKDKYEIYNISAGSWGPGNWVQYIKEYGLFNADKVVFLINSLDLVDLPSKDFRISDINRPTSNPPFAIWELINRYIFPRVKLILNNKFTNFININNKKNDSNLDTKINEGIFNLNEAISLVQANSIKLIAIQYWNKEEFESGLPIQYHSIINELLRNKNINSIQSFPYFEKCSNNGLELFEDSIHPNEKGQACLAYVLEDAVYF